MTMHTWPDRLTGMQRRVARTAVDHPPVLAWHPSSVMDAVVADGWPVLRRGLAAVLAQCGVTVTRETGTASEAVGALHAPAATVVVVGTVPDMGLGTAVQRLRADRPHVRVIAMVEGDVRAGALAALDAGADAVVARGGTDADLREAVMRVGAGHRFVAPQVLADAFATTPPAAASTPFTPREADVLRLLVEGRSNREIASALFVGEATIKTHLRNIYAKLGVANRVQAINAVLEL